MNYQKFLPEKVNHILYNAIKTYLSITIVDKAMNNMMLNIGRGGHKQEVRGLMK